MKPQVEEWTHRVRVLGQIAQQHPQSAYAGLGISLQLKWQYLQRTVPGVGTLVGPIEEALREKFFPALFRGEEINANFRKILGHSVKHGGLGIIDPHLSTESAYNTSKAASAELVDSLIGGSDLNYVGNIGHVYAGQAQRQNVRRCTSSYESWPGERSWQKARRETATIGK